MGRGRDFRGPRKRGFDDDGFFPDMGGGGYDPRPSRPPARSFGGPAEAEGPVIAATVKWFNTEKGFGFVELSDGSGDAFLHVAVLQASGHDSVPPGTTLKVQSGRGAKGMQVTKVHEVDASTATAQPPRGGHGGGPRPPRRMVDSSNAVELAGTTKWFNPDKGFGFIAGEDGGKDVFVHISVLEAAGLRNLAEGQRVIMRVVDTPKGREVASLSLA